MKYTAAALCCLLALASANVLKSDLQKRWEDFKREHGISYGSEVEHEFRFRIFGENLRNIMKHNREYRQGKHTYKVAVNKYADLLQSEFLEKMTGTFVPRDMKAEPQLASTGKKAAPESMDWRDKGAVTPVKDQGQCGSCWAFSTTGSLEGVSFLKTGKMVSLSEQNLMDCSTSYGNHGCNGGLMDLAFDYIKENGGVDTEESYPYEEKDGQKCRYNPDNAGASISGYKDIRSKDEGALQEAVGTVGPVSVAINAGQDGFRFYSEGVYTDSGCSGGRFSLNHGVLAVGYGSENGEDYWLVKNSWGTSWGDQGYIKMARNKSNQCGIATQASYPLL